MEKEQHEDHSDELLNEAKELFGLFDKNSEGSVDINELGTMLRGLNLSPTEEEVNNIKKEIDPSDSGKFNQDAFLEIIRKRPKETDTIEDLTKALAFLVSEDKTSSTIDAEEFKKFMTSKGEPLQSAEIEEVLSDFNIVQDEKINIKEFATQLMTK